MTKHSFTSQAEIQSTLDGIPMYVSRIVDRSQVLFNKEERTLLVNPFMAAQLMSTSTEDWLERILILIAKDIDARAAAAVKRIDHMVDEANHEQEVTADLPLLTHAAESDDRVFETPVPEGPTGVWLEYVQDERTYVDTQYVGTIDGIATFEVVPQFDPLDMKPIRMGADRIPGLTAVVFPFMPSGVERWEDTA